MNATGQMNPPHLRGSAHRPMYLWHAQEPFPPLQPSAPPGLSRSRAVHVKDIHTYSPYHFTPQAVSCNVLRKHPPSLLLQAKTGRTNRSHCCKAHLACLSPSHRSQSSPCLSFSLSLSTALRKHPRARTRACRQHHFTAIQPLLHNCLTESAFSGAEG